MLIIASRLSGMLYLICKRAIIVYIDLRPVGGFPGNVETPLPTHLNNMQAIKLGGY